MRSSLIDLGVQEVHVRQDVREQQPVMVAAEPADQRSNELGAAVLESALGHTG